MCCRSGREDCVKLLSRFDDAYKFMPYPHVSVDCGLGCARIRSGVKRGGRGGDDDVIVIVYE